jgi:hypothetical protein
MKHIKVFTSGNMRWTPFGEFNPRDIPFLKEYQVTIVSSVQEADVIVSQNLKYLRKHIFKYLWTKKFLLWTNEPRFDTTPSDHKKYLFGLVVIHIMNVYNRKVFHNTIPFNPHFFRKKLQLLPNKFELKNRKVVALMSFYKGLKTDSVMINNTDVDLIKKRTSIAIYGNSISAIALFGKGWPDNISLEDSRDGDWTTRKKDLLMPYNFNLSFENTSAVNYITEKIWDSIENYCLPIYYGNNGIYELFPENSFIDYSKINNPQKLFELIQLMSPQEFVLRMNKCIEVYQNFHSQEASYFIEQREKSLKLIVKVLNEIV